MMFDDIVIGSGLSALGVVCGLPARRNVLVVAGPRTGTTVPYPETAGVPSAHLGFGGLGNFWHGVIPTGLPPSGLLVSPEDFAELFQRFYPRTAISETLGEAWLFVPRRPIRPAAAWARLVRERAQKLSLSNGLATGFSRDGGSIVVSVGGDRYRARRLWIAAGVLHTPALLTASLRGFDAVRPFVSDHVISYLGQVDRAEHPEIEPPEVRRSPEGHWIRSAFDELHQALYTLKPARFSYRILDHSVEQRAIFGLPTGGVIAKLARAGSMGLLAEALYNKFGLFPGARVLSAYAQINVPDAFAFESGPTLAPRGEVVERAVRRAGAGAPWPSALTPSGRPDLFVRGIHLHHSIDAAALQRWDINCSNSTIQVVDASPVADIGGEHHSFKLMAAAFAKARIS